MTRVLIPRLRCTGVVSRSGFREYGFSIEDKDKATRKVVLTIEDGVFRSSQLLFQEAPDLCYQQLLVDLDSESAGGSVRNRRAITSTDIARYRDLHPNTKTRGRIK
jgi:hypothetical protein